jgi:GAF domain-containing protein
VEDQLIGTPLRAALEETGAPRGLLTLPRSGEHRIAAEATHRRENIVVRVRDEVVSESLLPLLDYVLSTSESVVIHDAAARASLVADHYLLQQKPCDPYMMRSMKVKRFSTKGGLPFRAFIRDRL